ncbi:CapA family protein [Bacillus sp. V3B]|uniref:CapA family protein n=1 Tax=Bacillus sp. V3B TaxID=2804915 RepID=UPI00210BFAD6|nr:CapA family protein [Bacillus sp. V3B]MCQ6276362.1 CapA family protein [Bacillus sp. V3B]
MKLRSTSYFVLFIIIVLIFSACSTPIKDQNQQGKTMNEKERGAEDIEKKETDSNLKEIPEPEPIVKTIHLSAVGDILIHNSVYEDAYVGHNQYDFIPMFELVKPYMQNADITFANQETVIGGVDLGLSSYPAFNSPVEIGDALKDAGVDLVSMANNHTLDKKDKAVPLAIEHWNKIDMLYTGAYDSFEDQNIIRVIEKDEIKVAFIAYTYGTNGIPVPEGKEFLVNIIDKQKIKEEIDRAKEMSDVIVLSLHFGNEYERMPNQSQQDLVQYVVDEGVDIILGTHPHVLQPVSWIQGKEGNKAFVIYSLGNFVSAQDQLYRQIGGMANIEIQKVIDGDNVEITLQNPKFLPTYVKFHNWRDYKIIPMNQLTNDDLMNAQGLYEDIKAHMSQWVPELEFIENI